jgi:uncharacterized membrane protein YvbJ
MVYCVKCGTNNPDDVAVCTKCGAQLYTTQESRHDRRRENECFGNRRMENECFGIPQGGTIVGLAIGVIILLGGVIWFLQQTGVIARNIDVWPFAIIIFGALIIIGALYGLRRRY